MKCGREVDESRSFCDSCMEEMVKYPVKANTVVKLPDHPVDAPVKKRAYRRKRSLKPEEQIAALRRSRRRLMKMLALTLFALLGMTLFALLMLERQNFAIFKDIFRYIANLF